MDWFFLTAYVELSTSQQANYHYTYRFLENCPLLEGWSLPNRRNVIPAKAGIRIPQSMNCLYACAPDRNGRGLQYSQHLCNIYGLMHYLTRDSINLSFQTCLMKLLLALVYCLSC
jgi:hypothetical protein